MSAEAKNYVRLGLFVLAGLFLVILTLYIIGKNQNLFGSSFTARARFRNVNGLITGDNIRFSGIQAGTVKSIRLLNDTCIEVTMLLDKQMKAYIHQDAIASIGTEGVIGNKMIEILPAASKSPTINNDDLLPSEDKVNTGQMLQKLDQTNDNIADISEELKTTVRRFNNSKALWQTLNDASLPADLRASFDHINQASANADAMVRELRNIVGNIHQGKGSVGALLTDTTLAHNLETTIVRIRTVGDKAERLVLDIDSMAARLQHDIRHGSGAVHVLLEDSALAGKLNTSLDNIRDGTHAFDQDMLALQHNFLLRGYFRRLAKKQKDSLR